LIVIVVEATPLLPVVADTEWVPIVNVMVLPLTLADPHLNLADKDTVDPFEAIVAPV
jgi:hypothetical protein